MGKFKPQRLEILYDSTPGGFTTNAILYEAEFSKEQFSIGGLVDTSSSYNVNQFLKLSSANGDLFNATIVGQTSLPTQSFGTTGDLRFDFTSSVFPIKKGLDRSTGIIRFYKINLYCSSKSTIGNPTSFTESEWALCDSIIIGYPPGGPFSYTLSFNEPRFASANTIAILFNQDNIDYQFIDAASVNPIRLDYISENLTILATNEAIGSFYWTASDGGVIE